MDATAVYNFKPVVQGTDWERTLEFKTNGVANDLTGWDAKMTVRDQPHSGGTEILPLTTTPNAQGSVLTISASTGLVSIRAVDVDTDLWVNPEYYYDLKLISPSSDGSKEFVPMTGAIPVIPKVTL